MSFVIGIVLFAIIIFLAFVFCSVSGACSREEEKIEQYYNDDVEGDRL